MPERRKAGTTFGLMPYIVSQPKPPAENLKQLVDVVTESVNAAAASAAPHGESRADSAAIEVVNISDKSLDQRIWFSITTPLKHQVPNGPFNCINAGEENVRCANTDGWGLVGVARHFGIDFGSSPLLDLTGGGSSASACAAAWLVSGGRVRSSGARRELPAELISDVRREERASVIVDFDAELGASRTESTSTSLRLIPSYTAELESRDGVLDGRWLLVSQHLLAWAALFAPERETDLPGIGLLFTRLRELESKCRSAGIEFV